MRRELGMVFILVFSAIIIPPQVSAGGIGSVDPGVSDVPTWQIGDKWIYAGSFDPTILVQEAGVSAVVGKINGDATTTVESITEMMVANVSTMVYQTSSRANFDKGGVTLDGYTGNLYIEYQVDEVVRVSDLATISSDLSLNVIYVPYGISSLTQDIADITISNSYDPANEGYDFPLRNGETWNTSYYSSTSWSGASDYITPFPPPTSGHNFTNWEVTDIGKPENRLGEQIGYGGCNASYELTSYDENGTETAFEWFCPEVSNYAWSHTEEDIGLVIDFRLKQYLPVGSIGVEATQNPGYRNNKISVETDSSITALNTPLGVWANVTDSSGNPQSGIDVEIRYEIESFSTTLTTGSNGSVWTTINVGAEEDSSETTVDYASHGIIAKTSSFGGIIGVSTITLDENIVGLDLVAALERASILRNRSGELVNLNAISGFNVLPGDQLYVELPVYNRGITATLPTDVHLKYPDGFEISKSLPSLQLFEQYIFSMNWTVPENASIENQTIQWEVDRNNMNTNDADSSNNLGILPLFVGRAPTFIAENLSGLTLDKLFLNASASNDEDGGIVWCEFNIPYDDGTRKMAYQKIMKQNCAVNWTWTDDGIYDVMVTVYDEEGDSVVQALQVEILNRAPMIEIISFRDEVKVEHPVTLYVMANDSDSEDPWPGLVDVHWPQANCDEGYYTRTCTTTAWQEGLQTFVAVGTDDDGNQSYASIDILFTNIAPHDVAVSMWDEQGEVIKAETQMTWQVYEDQSVELSARAEDSMDDLDNLHYDWDFGSSTDGRESRVPIGWTQAGMRTVKVNAIDSEGAQSGWVERWVDVQNVNPVVEPLPEIMAVAEGQFVTLTGKASDTPSDMASLEICWDVDPGADTDGFGSADDDCDVIGENLTWSWDLAGEHTVVFHVTDDDGARNSSTATITVINLPPMVRIAQVDNAVAGIPVLLDASNTLDSKGDKTFLTVVWDVDCTTDGDGDGIIDNDADLVGMRVNHTFSKAGVWKVKAIVWDEDVQNPASQSIDIEVDSPDRTAIEEVFSSLSGDEANPFLQLLALALVLSCIVLVMKRVRKKPESMWENEDEGIMERPMAPPSLNLFENIQSDEDTKDVVGLPLPESGLPEGWTMEQWKHYGHQWVANAGESSNERGQM